MNYSIYTSCFNIVKNNFNYWQYTIPKWINFIEKGKSGEIVIAVNKSEDNTLEILKNEFKNFNCIKIIETNFEYEDYAFDGKIKNAALQESKNEICLGLDLDEYASPNKNIWQKVCLNFLNSGFEALLLPVVDLCKTKNHIKSVGAKWYIHKQGLHRGIWKHALLENGKINTKKSDTCELLNKDNDLCKTAILVENINLNSIKEHDLPFIVHLGWLDWENRKNQNKTWQPVWSNRAGFEVKDIIHDKINFDKINIFEHGLNI